MDKNVLVYRFEELESSSGKMSVVLEAIDNISSISENLRAEMNDYWIGKASDAFEVQMKKMTGSIEKLYDDIRISKEKLDKAIALEKQNEESITNEVTNDLSADGIF